MIMSKITFIKNIYDRDGDVYDDCILLLLSDVNILKVKDTKEIKAIIKRLEMIVKEIDENY